MGFFPQLILLKNFEIFCQELAMSPKIVPETFSELGHNKNNQQFLPRLVMKQLNDKVHTLATDSAGKHSR